MSDILSSSLDHLSPDAIEVTYRVLRSMHTAATAKAKANHDATQPPPPPPTQQHEDKLPTPAPSPKARIRPHHRTSSSSLIAGDAASSVSHTRHGSNSPARLPLLDVDAPCLPPLPPHPSPAYSAQLTAKHARRPSQSKRPTSPTGANERRHGHARGLGSILESMHVLKANALLATDAERKEEENTWPVVGVLPSAIPSPSVKVDTAPFTNASTHSIVGSSTSFSSPSGVAASPSPPPPPSPSPSSSSSSLPPKSSKLLQQLVDAKLKPGEDPVRQIQMELDSERDAAAILKRDCLAILQLPSESRTDHQRSHLLRWLQSQNSVLLKELSSRVLLKLCEKVSLVTFASQKVVFKQGAPSDAFFIIMTGAVSIWIQTSAKKDGSADDEAEVFNHGIEMVDDNNNDDGNSSKQHDDDNRAHIDLHSDVDSSDPPLDDGSPSLRSTNSKYRRPTGPGLSSSLMFVGLMRAGEEKSAFGELGLVSGDPRSATIKCEEYTELLRVSKSDFHTVLKTYSESLKRKAQLIASFPGFRNTNPTDPGGAKGDGTNTNSIVRRGRKGGRMNRRQASLMGTTNAIISEKYISKLSMFFKEHHVSTARCILFSQGEKCNLIYFLVSGEVELLQTIDHQLEPGVIKRIEVVLTRIVTEYPEHLKPNRKEIETIQTNTNENDENGDTDNATSESNQPGELTSTEDVLNASKGVSLPPVVSSPFSSSSPSSLSGQILGETSLFLKSLRGCYDYTLRAVGPCAFLVIHKADFMRRMNFLLLSRFKQGVRDKIKLRQRRIREILLPKEVLSKGALKDHNTSGVPTSDRKGSSLTGSAAAASGMSGGGLAASGSSFGSQSAPSTFRSTHSHASHMSSLSMQSWSLRQKQLQLATHKNLRLLPTLTQSSSSSHIGDGGILPIPSLSVFEEAAMPLSPRTIQRAITAAAQARIQEVQEREQSAAEAKRINDGGTIHLNANLPTSNLRPYVPSLSFPSPPSHIDSAFSSDPMSPLISSSRRLILDVNPTIGLQRRGSVGLAPNLRPQVNLKAIQPTTDKVIAATQMEATRNDADVMYNMPHSLPRSLPSASSTSHLDVPNPPLRSHSLSPPRVRSPAGRVAGDVGSKSASSLIVPATHRTISSTTGRVALTPEQHIVLSTQLRSTDAATRAKQIVKVMQEMKDRNEDWVVTSKTASSNGSHSSRPAVSPLDFDPLPLDNVRAMWQRREEKRVRKKWSVDPSDIVAAGADAALGWTHIKPAQNTSGAHAKANTAQVNGKMVDPAKELQAVLAANSAHMRAQRMKEANVLGKVSHQVSITPTLLHDLSIIAPRSSILQEALSISGRSRNTHTHRSTISLAVSNAARLQSVDWPTLLASAPTNPFYALDQPPLPIVVSSLYPGANPHNLTDSPTITTRNMFRDNATDHHHHMHAHTNEEIIAHTRALKKTAMEQTATNSSTGRLADSSDPSASSPVSGRSAPGLATVDADMCLTTRSASEIDAVSTCVPSTRRVRRANPAPAPAPSVSVSLSCHPGLSFDPTFVAHSKSHFAASLNTAARYPTTATQQMKERRKHKPTKPTRTDPSLPYADDAIQLSQAAKQHDRTDKSGYQPQIRYS